jgi:hypothetical protein
MAGIQAARRTSLFQLHADAFRAVKQTLQMKARERIIRVHPDQRGKSRHGREIARLELGESLRILKGGRCRKSLGFLRFVGTKRLAPAAQEQIAHRPSLEIGCGISDGGTDADPGT